MSAIKMGTKNGIKPLEIKAPWRFDEKQTCTIGKRRYHVHDCIRLAKDLPVEAVQVRHLDMSYGCPCDGTLRSFIAHARMVASADLEHPILLNEDGVLIDGKHRLARAIMDGEPLIKVKRFDIDPEDGYAAV